MFHVICTHLLGLSRLCFADKLSGVLEVGLVYNLIQHEFNCNT